MALLGRTPHSLGRTAGRKLGFPGLAILAAGFVAAAALLPVAQSSISTNTGHQIRALEVRKADLDASIHLTQSEIAAAGAVERIDARARELGMVAADRQLFIQSARPAPVAGMPARYLNDDGHQPPAVAAEQRWWKALLSKLPSP